MLLLCSRDKPSSTTSPIDIYYPVPQLITSLKVLMAATDYGKQYGMVLVLPYTWEQLSFLLKRAGDDSLRFSFVNFSDRSRHMSQLWPTSVLQLKRKDSYFLFVWVRRHTLIPRAFSKRGLTKLQHPALRGSSCDHTYSKRSSANRMTSMSAVPVAFGYELSASRISSTGKGQTPSRRTTATSLSFLSSRSFVKRYACFPLTNTT